MNLLLSSIVDRLCSALAPLNHNLMLSCCIMLTLYVWGRKGSVCVCVRVCTLLRNSMHLLPIILWRLTEHCRAEEEIKSNHRKYVSAGSRLAVHIGFTLLTCMHACTHTHTNLHTLNPSSVNPAISMLWCSGADCQHQVWKR